LNKRRKKKRKFSIFPLRKKNENMRKQSKRKEKKDLWKEKMIEKEEK
jgi:hypothetical protein